MKKAIIGLFCVTLIIFSYFFYSLQTDKKAPPLIPSKILFGNPEKVSPTLSPDGRYLAYLAPDQNNVLNVWVKNLEEKEKDHLITSEVKRGIPSFFWQHDGKNILYIQDRDGDENWHLFQTNVDTKKTRDLTPFAGISAGIIAYKVERPHEILIKLNQRNPALFDIYRLDLQSGLLTLVEENRDNIIQWVADHKLVVRASAGYNSEGEMIVRVKDDENSPWRELMRWGPEDEGELVTFSPDGRFLYITTNKGTNTSKLLKVDLENASFAVVAEDSIYDVSGEVMINPVSHEIEAVHVEKEYSDWVVFDPSIAEDFGHLAKENEEMTVISRDLAGKKWIVKYSSDEHPSHYYLYHRNAKKKEFLFSAQPELEKYPLSRMTPISFKARDGMQLYGYLTLPLNRDTKNLASVLYVHGGPWARDSWGFDPWVQWLANRGYAVLQLNFRGSTGYGKEYLNAGNKEWGGKMHADLLDAKKWLIEQGHTDPEKVAIFGGSYGGYATLAALAFTPEEFCCGIDVVGPSNLITLIETIPPYWKPLLSFFDRHVGNLENEREFLQSRSPFYSADKIKRPLLIAQGANDPRVKQAESDQIVEAMRKNHQEVEYLLIEDEGHGFSRPENKLKFCSIAENFLHKHLGGRKES